MSRGTRAAATTAATSAAGATRPPAPAGRTARTGAAVTVVAARTVRKYMRSPQLLVFNLVNAAIFIVLFRYIFGGAIDLGRVAYVDFLMPGMVLTSALIAGWGIAVGVAEDSEQGFFDRLRSLPAPRIALPAGRVVGETLIVAWGTAVTVGLAFLVGFDLHGTLVEALLALGLCLVCGFAFVWMFVCVGLVAGNAQAAQGMSMLVFPVIFVSSAYVPVDTLPGWMQPVAEYQPVTVMCNAVRSLALGDPALAGVGHTTTYWVVLSLVWSTGILAVFVPLAVALYRRSP